MPSCLLFWPACRVLVVGCSSQPWLVPKKDESAFLGTWTKMLHLPLPDYAARRVSWCVSEFCRQEDTAILAARGRPALLVMPSVVDGGHLAVHNMHEGSFTLFAALCAPQGCPGWTRTCARL